jgi:hypothetical protein
VVGLDFLLFLQETAAANPAPRDLQLAPREVQGQVLLLLHNDSPVNRPGTNEDRDTGELFAAFSAIADSEDAPIVALRCDRPV